MKQLRITGVYGKNKSRKEVTIEVTDEVADFFVETFRKRSTGEIEIPVEGNNLIKIELSVLHAENKF